jgi:formyltetrahydrofolate synthetase
MVHPKNYIYRRGPTAVAHGGSYSTTHGCNVATATTMATSVGDQAVFKNSYIFCLNSDGGKLYM